MPDFSHEEKNHICGLDEAGRGPLAGPVVAACVFVPHDVRHLNFWNEVHDSKKLSSSKRERLFEQIKENAHTGIGIVQPDDIDRINILQSTFQAMRCAYHAMNFECEHALIDGNHVPPAFPIQARCLIKGDQKSISIAAASIIAKVTRDRLMHKLHEEFPHYGWKSNAGYGTAHHLQAIAHYGPSPHHRMSFAPLCHLKSA